jgi:alpha-mannosidase
MKNNKFISRRIFLNRTLTGAAALAVAPVGNLMAGRAQQQAVWPKDATKYSFRMVGNGHIDPVWLWPWSEGVSVVHSTFRSALDRMKETPGFVFTCSSAQFHQWVADNDPAMLAEIRRRVEEGRWNLVGGWWVEPDVNIPSGESLVRQGLYGQQTFQRLFGKRAVTAFNPDSFGHAGTLPQIIAKQGMNNYVFMRPAPHEKTLPADCFWWEGADGTRVLTYRIQQSYTADDPASIRRRIENILKDAPAQPVTDFMVFYGVGDHGGGPTKASILSIEELKAERGAPRVTFGGVDAWFEETRANTRLSLPVVKDDLQHHAVGCYTAEGEIKKNNRQAEAALVTAEKICAAGSFAWGAAYPQEAFTGAWKKLLFLQFHDSMAGTSLAAHSQDAREGYGHVLHTAREAITMALQKLEWQIPTDDPASQYLVVFNPHAWEVEATVEYDFNNLVSVRAVDDRGHALPFQWTSAQSVTGRKRALFKVTLPPAGYRQVRLMPKQEPTPVDKPAKVEGNTLENEFHRIRFSADGAIGILDKETGKEVFTQGANGCRAVVINDTSDTWSHDIKTFADEVGSFNQATVKILENGPLRATARVTSVYGSSRLTVDWSVYAGSREIEAKVTLDWHERLKMLKFSFPVDLKDPVATYEAPYGFIVRETNGNEDPGQRWIDLSGTRDGRVCGLTVVNDARYGYNVAGNDMRLSVARSAAYAHHNPARLEPDGEYLWMDQGIHTFRMLLVPHKEGWRESQIVRTAEVFIAPPLPVYQGIHPGERARSASFLSVDAPNVIVTSVKKAEEGDDMIIRCVELTGKATQAVLSFPSVRLRWTGSFHPCEIKTLRLNGETGAIKEVNLLEE